MIQIENQTKYGQIRLDKGGEFYNSSFNKLLKDNDIEMYSMLKNCI